MLSQINEMRNLFFIKNSLLDTLKELNLVSPVIGGCFKTVIILAILMKPMALAKKKYGIT